MKKFLFLALFLASGIAGADRVDDARRNDVVMYCSGVTRAFIDGYNYHEYGAKKEIKNVSAADAREARMSGAEPPKDGMYFIDYDKYTEQEKAYIQDHVYAGWDAAAAGLDAERASQKYMEICAFNEAKRRTMKQTDSSMHKAASSQNIGEAQVAGSVAPPPQQREYCSEVATKVYNNCMAGK